MIEQKKVSNAQVLLILFLFTLIDNLSKNRMFRILIDIDWIFTFKYDSTNDKRIEIPMAALFRAPRILFSLETTIALTSFMLIFVQNYRYPWLMVDICVYVFVAHKVWVLACVSISLIVICNMHDNTWIYGICSISRTKWV